MSRYVAVLLFAALASVTALAQEPTNLIANPAAEHDANGWRASGDAIVQEFDGNRCFVIRNGGTFRQSVNLPSDSGGKVVLFIAHVSGERVAADITDRPYLYGLTVHADGRRILQYNQASTMLGQGERSNQWTKAWGVFAIPEGASTISYQL